MNNALPKIIMPTGQYLDNENSLLAEEKILSCELPLTVTALSAAKAMASLFIMIISAVIAQPPKR